MNEDLEIGDRWAVEDVAAEWDGKGTREGKQETVLERIMHSVLPNSG